MIHEVYMPFNREQLTQHFVSTERGGGPATSPEQHIRYYLRSVENYRGSAERESRQGNSLKVLKKPCQIEKDEKFWTASCLMTAYHSPKRSKELATLLQKAYGPKPPINEPFTWDECVSGKLHLFFEANLPSPRSYKDWLRLNLHERQFIPYISDSAWRKANLEGATNADALLINEENGFAVIVEAKVLSDISCQVTYDIMRNQIARNIDVMLEDNSFLPSPLGKRDPHKTLFLLLTPRVFKVNPGARLYWYKLNEYKSDPSALGRDLPHRMDCDWEEVSRRLGWITWEDFRDVNSNCCRWLEKVENF